MDLIYTDANRNDLGVILEYGLDLAFGKDENDFELDMSIEAACLKENCYIYIEDTEYGGMIDSINPNTSNRTVKYNGRTWHGILDSKIIVPDKGQDHLIVDGDANKIIAQLLTRCGLGSLFVANDEESTIQVHNYKFSRYIGLYQGLRKMLSEFGGKLNLVYSNGRVKLSAIPFVDYTKNEEWDTSDMAIEINKHFNPINHLYCLGSGALKDRNVLELFTDASGTVQPYTTVDTPVKDSQYILDNRNQLFTGVRDNSQVYDYGNAQTAENYEILTTKPDNWEQPYVFTKYYRYNSKNNTYEKIERDFEDSYSLLTAKPDNWNYAYASYYYLDGDTYKSVDDSFIVTDTTYPLLRSQPIDWNTNYKDYYYYWTDGVAEEYKSVEGVNYNIYKKQTQKPTDWNSNKGNYYIEVEHWDYTYIFKKKRDGVWNKWEVTYHDIKIEEFTKKDYTCRLKKKELVNKKKVKISDFVKDKNNKAEMSDFRNWKNSKYRPFYTQYTKEKAPVFDSTIHRYKSEASSSPEFKANTFYEKYDKEIIPYFWVGGFYNKVYDNFADLVAKSIAKLQEYWSLDDVNISLDSDEYEYDIGDVVGAVESITNIAVTSSISKKIVTIDSGSVSIQYELGNENTSNIN